LLEWVPAEEVVTYRGTKILNGLFGVIKKGATLPPPDGRPLLRTIMNLTPTNRLQYKYDGDMSRLPMCQSWKAICLDESETLRLSSEDLRGAFYLFSLPAAWSRYLVFAHSRSGEEIGRTPGCHYYAACRTLPMGWKTAMAVIQTAHRHLLRSAFVASSGLLTTDREIRRDVVFPRMQSGASEWSTLHQVYCDDFDTLEVCDRCDDPSGLHPYHLEARKAYAAKRIPTSRDKAGVRLSAARRLGIWVDGDIGYVGAPADRLAYSLYGHREAGRLERAGQEGLGYPPRAAWSFAVFGMKGLKWVRGG
jgi:hypothetical protein